MVSYLLVIISIKPEMKWKKNLRRSFRSCEKKARKLSGLNGNRTHYLCDAGAVLYQHANWELVIL